MNISTSNSIFGEEFKEYHITTILSKDAITRAVPISLKRSFSGALMISNLLSYLPQGPSFLNRRNPWVISSQDSTKKSYSNRKIKIPR
jgi:hypothetical protein